MVPIRGICDLYAPYKDSLLKVGGVKDFLKLYPFGKRFSNLTSIFFKGVETIN